MPQYSSAKQAINAKLSGNTAMGPKNVPGTTGAVGGIAKPTPSIFDTPAAAGATLDINKTKPYNSLEYGQNTANLYPGSQFLQQAASGNQVSSGGQATTRGNQTGMSTGMQTGYNQFGSPQAIQSQGYQAYSPISQGLADYNLSQPSTSAGGKAVSDAYKQASTIKTGGDQILANQFANRDYQGLMDSQMAAKSAEAFYSNKAQQNQQIEKAIAQKQALDLQQQALTQSYEAKTALTKMQYQTKIKDTADSLNKAQAGILEAVGNDIVNLTALSDAKGHIMTGQMILDNLSQSRNIDLDQIANEYTNNIQSSVNTFLANNSRIGIAAAGMLKELEANGALDTAKGQMEASNILQTSYAAIGQSSQNLTQSLQYYNQVAQQLSQIAYQKASLEQNQRQFEITNDRLTAEANKPVVNPDYSVTYTDPLTKQRVVGSMEDYQSAMANQDLESKLSDYSKVKDGQWIGEKNGVGILSMPEGTTMKGTIASANYVLQCGEWISRALGTTVGNTYEEKLAKNTEKTGGIGSIAVWNPGGQYAAYGHAGIIIGDEGDSWKIKSANYHGDGKISIDYIPKSAVAGYRSTSLNSRLSNKKIGFNEELARDSESYINNSVTSSIESKLDDGTLKYLTNTDTGETYLADAQGNKVDKNALIQDETSKTRQDLLINNKQFQKGLKEALSPMIRSNFSDSKGVTKDQAMNDFIANVGYNPNEAIQNIANYIGEGGSEKQTSMYKSRQEIEKRSNSVYEKGLELKEKGLSKNIGAIQTPVSNFMAKYSGVGKKEDFTNELNKFEKKQNGKVPKEVISFMRESMMLMDDYARNKTGAAFTTDEQRFYEDLLGSNSNIDSILTNLETVREYQRAMLGAGYVRANMGDVLFDKYFSGLIK